MTNRAAQALGRLARGVPKSYSQDELDARTLRLTAARAKRWAGHKKKPACREVRRRSKAKSATSRANGVAGGRPAKDDAA